MKYSKTFFLLSLLLIGFAAAIAPRVEAVPTTPFVPSEVKVLIVGRATYDGKGYFVSDLARYGYNITWLNSDSNVNYLTDSKSANLEQYDVVILHQTHTSTTGVAQMTLAEVAHFTSFSGVLIASANSMFRNETSGTWFSFSSSAFETYIEPRFGLEFTDWEGGTGVVYNGTYYRVSTLISDLPTSIAFKFPTGTSFYMADPTVNGATQLYNFTATASGTGITYYQNATGAVGIWIRTPWVYQTEPSANLFRYWGLFGTITARPTATEIQERSSFLSRLIAYGLDTDFNTIVRFQPYAQFRIDDIGQPDYQLENTYIQPVLNNLDSVYSTTGVAVSHAFIAWHATDPDAWQTTGASTLALLKTSYAYMDYTSHLRHLRVDQSPWNTWTQSQWETEIDNIKSNTTIDGMPQPSGIIAWYDYTTGALNLLKALAAKGWYYYSSAAKDTDWYNLRVNQTVILTQPQQYGSSGAIENLTQINADITLAKRALENEYTIYRGLNGLSLINGFYEAFYHLPNFRRTDQVGMYSFKNVVFANISAEYPELEWVLLREAALFFGHRWADITSPTHTGDSIAFNVNVDNVPTVATIGKGMLWLRIATNTSSTIASVTINGTNWYAFDDYTIRIPAANSAVEITLGTPSTPHLTESDRKITATSYGGGQFSFTLSTLSGTYSRTKVYSSTNATEIYGAINWSYNATTDLLDITDLGSGTVNIFYYPTSVYAIEVAVGGIVAVGTGSLLFWWWRRKTKTRTVSVPT